MRIYIFLGFLTLFAFTGTGQIASAAEAISLPIRATIVQCGPRAQLAQSCRADVRCCALLKDRGQNIHLTSADDISGTFDAPVSYTHLTLPTTPYV